MFVATEIRGNIQRLVGGGRNDQLVTGRPISQQYHNQPSDAWSVDELVV